LNKESDLAGLDVSQRAVQARLGVRHINPEKTENLIKARRLSSVLFAAIMAFTKDISDFLCKLAHSVRRGYDTMHAFEPPKAQTACNVNGLALIAFKFRHIDKKAGNRTGNLPTSFLRLHAGGSCHVRRKHPRGTSPSFVCIVVLSRNRMFPIFFRSI
jgi:hypothetical protein